MPVKWSPVHLCSRVCFSDSCGVWSSGDLVKAGICKDGVICNRINH